MSATQPTDSSAFWATGPTLDEASYPFWAAFSTPYAKAFSQLQIWHVERSISYDTLIEKQAVLEKIRISTPDPEMTQKLKEVLDGVVLHPKGTFRRGCSIQ
ncbi:MAG TPA: hypothetical protein VLE89_01255 [Chlamydiales bacterium]|nr:hypothetical protein [Chlamydiales bacterium]